MLPEYWNYWHGGPKGYSGVSLHLRKEVFPARPEFSHPAFDVECRVVQAQLDGDARRRERLRPQRRQGLRGEAPVPRGDARLRRRRARGRRQARPLRRPERRAHRHETCTPRSARPAPSASAPTSASSSSASSRAIWSTSGRALDPDERRALHVVAALAQHAAEKPGLADRLRPRELRRRPPCDRVPRARRRGHERPRAGRGCRRVTPGRARRSSPRPSEKTAVAAIGTTQTFRSTVHT